MGADQVVAGTLLCDAPNSPPAQRSKRIDGKLPAALIDLPVEVIGEVDEPAYHSLAARDLQRGQSTGLPSGERVGASWTWSR